MRLSDLFETETEAPCAVQVDMNLLDVCRMSDEEICSYTGELRTVFGFRKYAENKERLGRFIAGNREHFSNVSETAMNALEELTHSLELKKIRISDSGRRLQYVPWNSGNDSGWKDGWNQSG